MTQQKQRSSTVNKRKKQKEPDIELKRSNFNSAHKKQQKLINK